MGVKVSVVIPVYNVEKYLSEALESILKQTLKDLEVICVDDESTDGSLAILQNYAKQDNRIKVVTQKNAGAGAARNNGLSKATGEYVYFFDSDDICESTLLEETVKKAESTNADMVAFDYDKFFEDGHTENFKGVYPEWLPSEAFERGYFNYSDCKECILTIVNVTPWNKIYRREFLVQGGYKFDEISSTNDVAFSTITVAVAERIAFISKRYLHYRVGHSATITSTKTYKLDNILYAINSARTQLASLPYFDEIRNAVVNFEFDNYLFAWEKIIIDLSDVHAKSFYEEIHKRANDLNDISDSCFSRRRIYQFFDTVKKNDYDTMLALTKKKIVVSLTTYPARIKYIPNIVDSLLSQTKKPDKILIWLSNEQFSEVPETLSCLDSKVEVRLVPHDLRPHKKYFYALTEFADDLVITVDDDLKYDNDMVEILYNSYLQYPNCLSTMRAHLMLVTSDSKVMPYSTWPLECDILVAKPSMQLFSTNGAGTIFPPHVFDEIKSLAFDEAIINETCLNADDLWIKACSALVDAPVVLATENRPLKYQEGSQDEALCHDNLERNANDVQWVKIAECLETKYGHDVLTEKIANGDKWERLVGVERLAPYFVPICNKSKDFDRLKNENEWLWSQVNSKAHKLGNALAKPIRLIKGKK